MYDLDLPNIKSGNISKNLHEFGINFPNEMHAPGKSCCFDSSKKNVIWLI